MNRAPRPQHSRREPGLRLLKAKTASISRILEGVLGIPERSATPPPALDMLIATILSQNTNDKNSHRAYLQLRAAYPTWDAVARAPLPGLRRALRIGGMANQKSVRIRAILREVHRRYHGYDLSGLGRRENASILEELTALHGVGRKTAACVLLFALQRDVFPVDTHVHRLCVRLGLTPGSRTPEETFDRMQPLVPRGKAHALHTNLIRFGRKVCRSAHPACDHCVLFQDCVFEGKQRTGRPRGTASRADHDFMLLDSISK